MRIFSLLVGAAVIVVFAGCGGGGSSQYLCNDPNDPSSCSPYTPPAPQTTVIPVPMLPPGCSQYQAALVYPVVGQAVGPQYAGTVYVAFSGRMPASYLAVEVLKKDAAGVVSDEIGSALQVVSGSAPSYVPVAPSGTTLFSSANLPLDGAVAFDVRLVDDRFPPVCPSQDLGGLFPQSVVRSTPT